MIIFMINGLPSCLSTCLSHLGELGSILFQTFFVFSLHISSQVSVLVLLSFSLSLVFIDRIWNFTALFDIAAAACAAADAACAAAVEVAAAVAADGGAAGAAVTSAAAAAGSFGFFPRRLSSPNIFNLCY